MKKTMMKIAAGAAAIMAAAMFAVSMPTDAHAAGYYDTFCVNDLDTCQYGYDLPVSIVNGSGKCIEYLYISPVADNIWGADILGNNVLCDGDVMQSTFDVHGNHTVYEVRAVFLDGSEQIYTNIDLSDAPITGISLDLFPDDAYVLYV